MPYGKVEVVVVPGYRIHFINIIQVIGETRNMKEGMKML